MTMRKKLNKRPVSLSLRIMGELPPPPDDMEQDPIHSHRHSYRTDINDWWCYDCDTVTDFCVEYNDFGQGDRSNEET
jgi:hypothetical protein